MNLKEKKKHSAYVIRSIKRSRVSGLTPNYDSEPALCRTSSVGYERLEPRVLLRAEEMHQGEMGLDIRPWVMTSLWDAMSTEWKAVSPSGAGKLDSSFGGESFARDFLTNFRSVRATSASDYVQIFAKHWHPLVDSPEPASDIPAAEPAASFVVISIIGKLIEKNSDAYVIDWYGGSKLTVALSRAIGKWGDLNVNDWLEATVARNKNGKVVIAMLLGPADEPESLSEEELERSYAAIPAAKLDPVE